ncbi:MAG: hypothetical protein AABW63_02630 [Nanoarchaeota archaeon]
MEKNRYVFLFFELLVIGIFVMGLVSADIYSFFNGFGSDPKNLVLMLIVIIILYAVIYDVTMFFPFISSPWVRYVLAGGLTLAVFVFGWVQWLADNALAWAAWLGAFSVFFLIIGGFLMLIALGIGHNAITRWAMRVRMGMEGMRADRAAHETAQTIRSLREIHDELEN